MKICPYCGAENRDNAAVCYFCGNDVRAWPPAAPQTDPTQPVNIGGAYTTQPFPPAPPYPGYPPAGGSTEGRPPTQEYNPQQPQPGYGQNPGYVPNQAYPPPPAYQPPPPVYYPPPPPPPAQPQHQSPSRMWPVLLLGLGLVFLCVSGLALATIASTTGGGLNRLGSQLATQMAQVVGGADSGSQPTQPPALLETPTPWPTFTPADTAQPTGNQPPVETPTPDATQASYIKKLLSPECSNALDQLQAMSSSLSSNPANPLNASWRTEFNQSIADMKTYCGSLEAASPVPGLISDAQENLNLANAEFDQAGKLFDEGVKELNPSKLLQAGEHIQQAAKHLDQTIAALKKIGR